MMKKTSIKAKSTKASQNESQSPPTSPKLLMSSMEELLEDPKAPKSDADNLPKEPLLSYAPLCPLTLSSPSDKTPEHLPDQTQEECHKGLPFLPLKDHLSTFKLCSKFIVRVTKLSFVLPINGGKYS